MAFYKDDEEEGQGQDQGTGMATGPEAATIDSSGGGAAGAANAPDSPGNFVGIKQYLDANKTQVAKLGDQTAAVITNTANQARQGQQALNQEADEKIKTTNPLGADLTDKIKNSAEALTDQERAQAKATAAAQYKGPQNVTGLNSYQSAQDSTRKASENAALSGTEQGRMSLISQVNNKPRTSGMNVFDNALLQAGGGREKLAQAAQGASGLQGDMDATANAIQSRIGRADDPNTPDIDESSGAVGTTARAQADAQKAIQDALAAWKSGFQPKVQEAQNNLVNLQNRVTGDLGDDPYSLDDETLGLLGLSDGQHVYNLNLNDYLKLASPSDINAGNVASAQDYARYAALADLSGDTSGILDPANVSQAGTAPSFGIDTARLQGDLSAREQDAAARLEAMNAAAAAKKAFYNRWSNGDTSGDTFAVNLSLGDNRAKWNSLLRALAESQDAYSQLNPNQTISKRTV